MGSDIIVVFIGIVLISIGIMGFKKEMTLLKMECEGIKIENKETSLQLANILFN
jgi:hypothetical protein